MSDEVENLIQDLDKLSQVYAGAPIQKDKYEKIYCALKDAFVEDRTRFTEGHIKTINRLKEVIDKARHLRSGAKLKLVKFYSLHHCSEARDYLKTKHTLPSKALMFHKGSYDIGQLFEWNRVERTCNLLSLAGRFEWHKLGDLVIIGSYKKLWGDTRESHCWRPGCNELLGPGSMKCKVCAWYKCPVCKSCNCNRPQSSRHYQPYRR